MIPVVALNVTGNSLNVCEGPLSNTLPKLFSATEYFAFIGHVSQMIPLSLGSPKAGAGDFLSQFFGHATEIHRYVFSSVLIMIIGSPLLFDPYVLRTKPSIFPNDGSLASFNSTELSLGVVESEQLDKDKFMNRPAEAKGAMPNAFNTILLCASVNGFCSAIFLPILIEQQQRPKLNRKHTCSKLNFELTILMSMKYHQFIANLDRMYA